MGIFDVENAEVANPPRREFLRSLIRPQEVKPDSANESEGTSDKLNELAQQELGVEIKGTLKVFPSTKDFNPELVEHILSQGVDMVAGSVNMAEIGLLLTNGEDYHRLADDLKVLREFDLINGLAGVELAHKKQLIGALKTLINAGVNVVTTESAASLLETADVMGFVGFAGLLAKKEDPEVSEEIATEIVTPISEAGFGKIPKLSRRAFLTAGLITGSYLVGKAVAGKLHKEDSEESSELRLPISKTLSPLKKACDYISAANIWYTIQRNSENGVFDQNLMCFADTGVLLEGPTRAHDEVARFAEYLLVDGLKQITKVEMERMRYKVNSNRSNLSTPDNFVEDTMAVNQPEPPDLPLEPLQADELSEQLQAVVQTLELLFTHPYELSGNNSKQRKGIEMLSTDNSAKKIFYDVLNQQYNKLGRKHILSDEEEIVLEALTGFLLSYPTGLVQSGDMFRDIQEHLGSTRESDYYVPTEDERSALIDSIEVVYPQDAIRTFGSEHEFFLVGKLGISSNAQSPVYKAIDMTEGTLQMRDYAVDFDGKKILIAEQNFDRRTITDPEEFIALVSSEYVFLEVDGAVFISSGDSLIDQKYMNFLPLNFYVTEDHSEFLAPKILIEVPPRNSFDINNNVDNSVAS